jgi:hypothetical protein
MRRSTLLWSVLCIAVVIGLFVVKHRVQDLEDRLHALNAEILSDRDATQVLEAEWSYLNQPARLEALSRKLLGMEPPTAEQTLTLDEFRLQTAPAEQEGTAIADILPMKKPVAKAAPTTSPKIPKGKPDTNDWLKPILAKMKKEQ